MKRWRVEKTAQEQSVSGAIRAEYPRVSSGALFRALKARDVRVNGKRVGADAVVRGGDEIAVYLADGQLTPPVLLDVLFLNEQLMIVVKPVGLPSVPDEHGGETLLDRAAAYLQSLALSQEIHACHRLDVNTGGVIALARTVSAQEEIVEAFRAHRVLKTYECLVRGCPELREGELRHWLVKDASTSRVRVCDHQTRGAVTMETRYQVIEAGDISRLRVYPLTGRTHQIRAHLAYIGHPILGDDAYGDRIFNREHRARTQKLWACAIQFPDGFLSIEKPRWCAKAPF